MGVHLSRALSVLDGTFHGIRLVGWRRLGAIHAAHSSFVLRMRTLVAIGRIGNLLFDLFFI
jgi:hypothetical protein